MLDLTDLFYPKNIAVIGVSQHPLKGGGFISALTNSKYPGKIYLINPRHSELFGKKLYSSILEVPDVDLAIIAVPARKVPEILKQCSGKVKFAVIFTSGFSEVGNKELEEEIVKIAHQGNIRLIGPNCLGVHCNVSRISFFPQQEAGGTGNVGFLSQSGGHAGTFTILGIGKGLKFNKTVSLGNQSDLTMQDFIEYFGNDDEIKIIGAYIEDIKRQDFCRKVSEVTKKKPVFLWKGGVTEEGKRAAFSHTGALAISNELWNPIMKQIGVITTDTMEELGDLMASALLLEGLYPKGLNVGIIVGGGGSSVEITDACVKEGLHIPNLSLKTKEKLSKLIPDINTSVNNPVDLGGMGFMPDILRRTVKIVHDDPNIDALVTYQMTERFVWFNQRVKSMRIPRFDFGKDTANAYKRVMKIINKPLICVIPRIIEADFDIEQIRINFHHMLHNLDIPIFPTVSRASKVLVRLYNYQKYLQRRN